MERLHGGDRGLVRSGRSRHDSGLIRRSEGVGLCGRDSKEQVEVEITTRLEIGNPTSRGHVLSESGCGVPLPPAPCPVNKPRAFATCQAKRT